MIPHLGSVYQAYEIGTLEEVVVKSAMDGAEAMALKQEHHILSRLRKCVGIPKVLWLGREKELHVMVLECLGPSLEERLRGCGGKFSLNVVTNVASQLVCSNDSQHVSAYFDGIASCRTSRASIHPITSIVTSNPPTF